MAVLNLKYLRIGVVGRSKLDCPVGAKQWQSSAGNLGDRFDQRFTPTRLESLSLSAESRVRP